MQVCLSMCSLLVDTDTKGLNLAIQVGKCSYIFTPFLSQNLCVTTYFNNDC